LEHLLLFLASRLPVLRWKCWWRDLEIACMGLAQVVVTNNSEIVLQIPVSPPTEEEK